MSLHVVTLTRQNGEEATVAIGYDRPLDYVHCRVVDTKNSKVLYSNLSDPNAGTFQPDVRYYVPVLESFGLQIPEVMYDQVEADAAAHVGNRLVRYAPDGTVLEQRVS